MTENLPIFHDLSCHFKLNRDRKPFIYFPRHFAISAGNTKQQEETPTSATATTTEVEQEGEKKDKQTKERTNE